MSGWYYKQWNDLFDRAWANDSKMVAVYVYLHCHAFVQQKKWHGLIIRRGSCPTSRAAIMEATGLSEQEVKTRLRKLAEYGEITVKTTNHGNVISVCDYDVCNNSEDLFGLELTTQEPANNPPRNQPTTHPIYNRVNSEDNIVISSFSPYNKRENKAVVREIQKIYNNSFDGILGPWQRLSDKMIEKVCLCIGRYDRQSVDMVFDQVKHEQLYMNKNGFIPSFDFIFSPKQYGIYLERAQLRQQKKAEETPKPQQSVGVVEQTEVQHGVSREEYEKIIRKAAAEGHERAIWLVEQWDNKIETV